MEKILKELDNHLIVVETEPNINFVGCIRCMYDNGNDYDNENGSYTCLLCIMNLSPYAYFKPLEYKSKIEEINK
jgi:hypothetical protein